MQTPFHKDEDAFRSKPITILFLEAATSYSAESETNLQVLYQFIYPILVTDYLQNNPNDWQRQAEASTMNLTFQAFVL